MSGNDGMFEVAARAYWEKMREVANMSLPNWDECSGKSRRNVRACVKAALLAVGLEHLQSVELHINVVDNATPKLEQIRNLADKLIRKSTSPPSVEDWARYNRMELHNYMPDFDGGSCKYTNYAGESCDSPRVMHGKE